MASPPTKRASRSGASRRAAGKTAAPAPIKAAARVKAAAARPRRPPAPAVDPAVAARAEAHAARERFRGFWETLLTRVRAVPAAPQGGVALHHAALATPVPAWLFLSSGLAERGLELLLRVPRGKDEAAPPPWIEASFRELVGAAAAPGVAPPSPEQVVTPTVPLAPGTGTDLAGFAFAADPALAPLVPARAQVVPLLAVGITRDEARLVREWSPQGLLEVLGRADPQLLTDPDRQSMLQSPRARTAIEQRVEREGSSLSAMRASRSEVQVAGEKRTWRLAADAVDTFISLLKGRTGHQRPFTVHAPGGELQVVPADHPGLQVEGTRATLALSQTAARLMRATLRAAPGRYAMDAIPGLTIEVV